MTAYIPVLFLHITDMLIKVISSFNFRNNFNYTPYNIENKQGKAFYSILIFRK